MISGATVQVSSVSQETGACGEEGRVSRALTLAAAAKGGSRKGSNRRTLLTFEALFRHSYCRQRKHGQHRGTSVWTPPFRRSP